MKLQALVSSEFCKIFKNIFFHRPPGDCFNNLTTECLKRLQVLLLVKQTVKYTFLFQHFPYKVGTRIIFPGIWLVYRDQTTNKVSRCFFLYIQTRKLVAGNVLLHCKQNILHSFLIWNGNILSFVSMNNSVGRTRTSLCEENGTDFLPSRHLNLRNGCQILTDILHCLPSFASIFVWFFTPFGN